MRIFIAFDYRIELAILRWIEFLQACLSSLSQAVRLRVERPKPRPPASWLAHALNGRRVAGSACDGELGMPAVTSLAG